MQIWFTLLLVLQILSAMTIIGLVLVQHGKGADMGASFGSGASGSLFGATGSANFLSRSTAICATVFFLATLGLSYVNTHSGAARTTSGGSVLDQAATPASGAAPAASGAGAGAIPTTPAGTIPTAPAAPTVPSTSSIPAPASVAPAAASSAGK
jgi:preprotein translocase subunit SecG